ncbi:site-specific DNA-methyltransferase [Pseudomonas sp. 15A4]|uniref:site-specific DNA-methyltransferase n=1 Tax=Pseudomonas sp. 15A4 TaxID=2804761 RepID=UPI00196712AF|nr:site-specific DNA-methyltransferase [Pseudomonas sp. 15A4]QSB20764.1 site-specific DNA-methyltransferase [Pseudomonas sp. 15A4]
MDKLKMHSPNLTEANINKLAELFPNCITEALDAQGGLKKVIDFDLLRQELASNIVEGAQERYQLNWPGKREALLAANTPIAKSLRPSREESVDFDKSQNLFIEGDNLEALKLLQENYLGKVKLIYIDPPYNTGGDFVYQDDFSESQAEFLVRSEQKDELGQQLVLNSSSNGRFHSRWLNMMYPRLKLARNLLRDDGVLLVSIDEAESANLRKLCEEIFGSENYAGDIVWKNSSKNDQDYISVQHEYIFCFVKSKKDNLGQWLERKEGLDEIYKAFGEFKAKHGSNFAAIHKEALAWYRQFPESNPIYSSKHYSWMDENGVYFPDNVSGPNVGQYVYELPHPVTGKNVKQPSRGWFCPEEKLKDLARNNLIHFGEDETTVPCLKTYLKKTEYKSLSSVVFRDGRAASKRLRTLFGDNIFTNPKDEFLLSSLMKAIGVQGNDIVLDFFAGSGSTGHAVMNLNHEQKSSCRYILVQLQENLNETYKTAVGLNKKVLKNAIEYLKKRNKPEILSEICKERLRLCGKNFLAEDSLFQEKPHIDLGFRVLKIDTSNMKEVYYKPDDVSQNQLFDQVDNIREDRTVEDLLFQVLLDWGVDLALPISQQVIAGKTVFFVDGDALVACFDTGIDEDFVKLLAGHKPLRVVFRDAGFANDSVKINIEQVFKLLSPATEIKTL